MIKYGLKLWSSNVELFSDAVNAHAHGAFDFIELYCNPDAPLDWSALAQLKDISIMIHAPAHTVSFHMFLIGGKEKRIWKNVLTLADLFESPRIVLHPGRDHTLASFQKMLSRIDDRRITIENMAGLDIANQPMFGQYISDLIEIRKIKQICFDFEKAVKAARYQNISYKEYIAEALEKLAPTYFHISGGNSNNPTDEHTDLFESDIDFFWIKRRLEPVEANLVFETPKRDALANDLKNMHYFRNL